MSNPPFNASDAQLRLVESLLQGRSVNDTIELSVGTVGVIINRVHSTEELSRSLQAEIARLSGKLGR